MEREHPIIEDVYAAKEDNEKADRFIQKYLPFIRSEASKFMARLCTEQDDEHSIAIMAFYEAMMSFERSRGAFMNYASMLIRSRLIDFSRKEARHRGLVSLDEERGEEDKRQQADRIIDDHDYYEESALREATRQEIEELTAVMAQFDVSFSDVADNCPRQERTREACTRAIQYAGSKVSLLENLLRTKKLPMAQLALGSGVDRKTLERHRKYLLAMLLIQTNGYEIIRGHLYRVLRKKGATA